MINEIEEALGEELVNHSWFESAVDFDYYVVHTIEGNIYIVKVDSEGEFSPSILHEV